MIPAVVEFNLQNANSSGSDARRRGINRNKFHDLLGKGHERVGEESWIARQPPERARPREKRDDSSGRTDGRSRKGEDGERGTLIDPRNEFKPRVKRPDFRADCIRRGIMKILLASSAPEDSLTAY